MGSRKFGHVYVALVRRNHEANLGGAVGRRTRGDGETGNRWEWGRLGLRLRPNHACLCLIVIQCRWYLVYVLMYDCKQIWKRKK